MTCGDKCNKARCLYCDTYNCVDHHCCKTCNGVVCDCSAHKDSLERGILIHNRDYCIKYA